MTGRWSFFIDEKPWTGDRSLFIRLDGHEGTRGFVKPFEVQRVEPHLTYDIPTLTESREDREDLVGDVTGFLQAALDAAWSVGIRPRGFADHTNEIAAVRYHLEDMRTLAKLPPKGSAK